MSNDQDENNYNSTDQISHLGTEENGGNQENIISSSSSYASIPKKKNKFKKRKKNNESGSFSKKTRFEDFGSCTVAKQVDNEDNKVAYSTEHHSLALMGNNCLENYLLEQERLHKHVIREAKNQKVFEESSSPGGSNMNQFQWNKIMNSGEKFDFPTLKATNSGENKIVSNDFCENVLDGDKEWNCKESAYPESLVTKCQEPFFTTNECENPPSDRKMHPTSIFSELPIEMNANNQNKTNNSVISKTGNLEEQRAFLGEVSGKSDIEFLILPSTSAYQCIENNESFNIPIEHMILINEAERFTDTEIKDVNKKFDTCSTNLGVPGEMKINDTENQTSLPTNGVSYSKTINSKAFIPRDEDKVPNMHPEMKKESNIQPSVFSKQDNVSSTVTYKLNTINKYNQETSRSEIENPYLESIISPDSGTLCGQVEEPMILGESTDSYFCKRDEECTNYLQNPDHLENPTKSRECIIINGLEDNHDKNDRSNLMEYEIGRLENDDCKILTTETLQLNEFKTGIKSFGDIIMPNRVNLENTVVPTAIRGETIAQSPNALNVDSFNSSHINIENSRFDKKEMQGSVFTHVTRAEQTITNTKNFSSNISDVSTESCSDQFADERPQGIQKLHNLQSSTGVTRKSIKEAEKCIINKLVQEYIRNKPPQEFTVQDIVKFVVERNVSLPLIAVVQSIRISLENCTKTGVLTFKTNGKYKIGCNSKHRPLAVCSEKERTGIEKRSIQNGQSKQNIEVEDNLHNAGNSMEASEIPSTALNYSIQ